MPLRILVPSIVDPGIHRGGAGVVTRNFVKTLQREPMDARIEYVCPPSADARFHRVRQMTSLTRSVGSSLPAKACFTYSRRFRVAVQRMLREEAFDLVLLNGSDLLWLLAELPAQLPRVLLAHNIEHELFRSQIESLGATLRPFRRSLLADWRRLRDYEVGGLGRVENVIFLSSADATLASELCPRLNALVTPPLFDYEPSKRRRKTDLTAGTEIGFPADFGWWPNREGLRWFVSEVLPDLEPSTRLHLFGDRSVEAPKHPQIVSHGFVSSVDEIWEMCDFIVCPIHRGGGVKVKVAEAMYNGVPVVATPFALRGLPLAPDPGTVILEGADEWIRYLRSKAARGLSSRRLPNRVGAAFKIDAHVDAVQTFVSDAVQR